MKLPDNKAHWAFLGHRISGLALALFLPVHFYVLAMALEDGARLDAFLRFSDMWAMKAGEWLLLILLALHLSFGLRVLALEMLPWAAARDPRLRWIDYGVVASLAVGMVFLARVLW